MFWIKKDTKQLQCYYKKYAFTNFQNKKTALQNEKKKWIHDFEEIFNTTIAFYISFTKLTDTNNEYLYKRIEH